MSAFLSMTSAWGFGGYGPWNGGYGSGIWNGGYGGIGGQVSIIPFLLDRILFSHLTTYL